RPRRERSAPRSRPAVALRWGGGTDSLPVPWWAGGAPPPAPSSAPHPSARARRDPMPAWSRRPSPRVVGRRVLGVRIVVRGKRGVLGIGAAERLRGGGIRIDLVAATARAAGAVVV